MGTAKRERQKANRQAKLERIDKEEKQQKARRTGIRLAVILPLAIAAVVLIGWLAGRGGDDDEAQATVPAVTDTLPGATTPATLPAVTVPGSSAQPTAFVYGDGECPATDGSTPQTQQFDKAFALCIDPTKTYSATIETNKGTIEVALEPADYPGTVNNFVSLARSKYYDGTICHRIIAEFVVQCGRPGGADTEARPGYTINEEIPVRPYKIGDLVMAKTSAPNSTGGQIFIITGNDGAALPPQYSIVGSITAGLDVAEAMEKAANPAADTSPLEEIKLISVTITES